MIIAEHIEKSYNGERVLTDISLTVARGEFVTIMGESGSGKSTLLSILGGFLPPDGGRVTVGGRDIATLTPEEKARMRSRELGFVFQSFRLIPTLTAYDNMLLPATLGGMTQESAEPYLRSLTSRLGLDGLLRKYPDELSGGQCQRVAIVRALLYRPSAVILDEPTGALDSEMEKRVMTLLRELNEREGTTLIAVTHSAAVAAYAHRVIRLSDGVIDT